MRGLTATVRRESRKTPPCLTGLLVTLAVLVTGCVDAQRERDFSRHFQEHGVDGCIILHNRSTDEYVRYNAALCDTGYLPASTFKIPNSLIFLNEGVISDTSEVIKWDGLDRQNEMWNRDQTLRSALIYSCVWVYSRLAEKVGIDRYYDYVKAFDYGNKDLDGPPDRFWLQGRLRISANQQVEFLEKFYYNRLPVPAEAVDIVKDLIVIEKTVDYIFSAKTGGAQVSDSQYIMWLVGYVEKGDEVWFYAMNFLSGDFAATAGARYEIVRDILCEMDIL